MNFIKKTLFGAPSSLAVVFAAASLYQTALAQSEPTKVQVGFRNGPLALAAQPQSGSSASNPSASSEALADQRDTLEAELRFARNKVAAAERRMNVARAAGQSEALDAASVELQDWNARVETLEAELRQIDAQLQQSVQLYRSDDSGDPGIVVPGENLEVFVVEDSSFNGRYPVRRGGYIIMPQVGRIYVAGNTIAGAEAAVKKALQGSQLRNATVMIEKIEGIDLETGPVVFLSGEFKNPRPFRIRPGTSPSLVSVILSCGGVTSNADLTRVRIMRIADFKSVVEEVNVQKILEGGGLTSDVRLNDGDVVTIPAGGANDVWITGRVRQQGVQKVKPDEKLTVYVAILNAGGFSRFADMKKVYILREMPDGSKTKIPVNVKEIKTGEAPDVPLVGNDIVVVPERFFSF